ncbi:hypothetical protein [Prevotella bivia]|jgi:hypothetical protein|uniref:Uncharacterized protein n=1 Tax=Prevotella bivia TaxID=28125 RepID=A0A137SRL4_9BACT|nr:hypothetical protein [Prevotella bivia]KXO15130.1 hypothetical protein HMPREF3202_02101 [Prevotella bivia]WIL18578.1 hypothetical protein QP022_09855 [Prevotella bivia]
MYFKDIQIADEAGLILAEKQYICIIALWHFNISTDIVGSSLIGSL